VPSDMRDISFGRYDAAPAKRRGREESEDAGARRMENGPGAVVRGTWT